MRGVSGDVTACGMGLAGGGWGAAGTAQVCAEQWPGAVWDPVLACDASHHAPNRIMPWHLPEGARSSVSTAHWKTPHNRFQAVIRDVEGEVAEGDGEQTGGRINPNP